MTKEEALAAAQPTTYSLITHIPKTEMRMSQVAALMSDHTSCRNKLALVAEYVTQGFHLEWRWQGRPYRSRMEFQFHPEGRWVTAKSFEHDVLPLMGMDKGTSVCVQR